MKDKTYALYNGLFEVKKRIKKMLEHDPHIFIFVSGGSASGKTSRVANNIQKFFPNDSIVISMDNYFRGLTYAKKHNLTFDEPDFVDVDFMLSDLKKLKRGETIMMPRYDFKISEPILNAIKLEPAQIIIIEGLFTLDHRFDDVSDLNIFVETSTNGRLIRRVLRDLKRTNWSSKKIVDYFKEVVNAMHEKYIEPQKENADMILLNEFSAFLEVRNLDVEKFKKDNNIPHFN